MRFVLLILLLLASCTPTSAQIDACKRFCLGNGADASDAVVAGMGNGLTCKCTFYGWPDGLAPTPERTQ